MTMISINLILILLLIVLPSVKPVAAVAQIGSLLSGGTKIETIETAALSEMLRRQSESETTAKEAGSKIPSANFVVVDVRSEAEVNVSVIPRAITKAQFEKRRDQYRGRLVIPYCTVGGRSGAYAQTLVKRGVKVKNFKGSILKWIDAGLPLVTLQGKPTNRVHTYSDRYQIPLAYEQVTR